MTYTEKELNQFLHGISLSLLSKKSAQHWRYDEETAKEIEWLEALERKVRADKADRKTEPNLILPERMERGERFEVGETIVVMNRDDYYDLLCKSWKDESHTDTHDEAIKAMATLIKAKTEPQTDCLTCRYNSDEWDSPKCDGCSKAHSNYEPQLTEKCPFDDSLPCEWVCTEYGKCKYKPKTEPIPHDDYIESGNDHLEARCLNCHNAKACKENHWEVCEYEPWKLTAVDDEPQTERSE